MGRADGYCGTPIYVIRGVGANQYRSRGTIKVRAAAAPATPLREQLASAVPTVRCCDVWIEHLPAQDGGCQHPVSPPAFTHGPHPTDPMLLNVDSAHTSPETLRLLSAHPDGYVRRMVADHGSCPADVLATLAADSDREVRFRVADNRNTPAEAVELLLSDDVPMIVMVAAEHQNLPKHLRALWQLAH